MSQPVATFTIGFEDAQGFDERPYARLVAERFKTNHTEFVVNPDAASLMEKLVWYNDQPFGDSSALPTYILSELTRKHVTVALCGDGGDELFAGYERFAAALALPVPAVPKPLQSRAQAIVDRLPPGAFSGRAQAFSAYSIARTKRSPTPSFPGSATPHRRGASPCAPRGPTWDLEDYRRHLAGNGGG